MSLSYTLQKLMEATIALASGTAPLQRRLGWAFTYLSVLKPEDWPEGWLRGNFLAIREAMSSVESSEGEGRIAASANAMSEVEASRFAEGIVSLLIDIAKRDPAGEYHRGPVQ